MAAGGDEAIVGDPLAHEFWEGLCAGRLVIQSCAVCGYLRWPPGPICPECQSEDASWQEVAPEGRLISFAVYHRAFDPEFAEQTPYVVGYVELSSGPRLYGIVEADPALLSPDDEVRAVFATTDSGEPRMVRWRLSSTLQH